MTGAVDVEAEAKVRFRPIVDIRFCLDKQRMAGLFQVVTKLFGRWSHDQETALRQLTEGKTVGQRIAGFAKSERMDAKFFLLALAPFVPIMISDQLDWSRGILWHAWFWLSAAWAVFVVGAGFIAYWRALRRSFKR